MSKSNLFLPEEGGDFPEIDLSSEGTMKDEILKMVVGALNTQGFPGLDVESLRTDPLHRKAAIDMLRDCRPLPVILDLIENIESGRI